MEINKGEGFYIAVFMACIAFAVRGRRVGACDAYRAAPVRICGVRTVVAVKAVTGIERTQMTIRLCCSVGNVFEVMGDRGCAPVRSRVGEVHASVIVA